MNCYICKQVFFTKKKEILISNVCTKTQCLDGKVQFRGLRRKKIVMFTWVNEQIFFKRNEENGLFGQTLFNTCGRGFQESESGTFSWKRPALSTVNALSLN